MKKASSAAEGMLQVFHILKGGPKSYHEIQRALFDYHLANILSAGVRSGLWRKIKRGVYARYGK